MTLAGEAVMELPFLFPPLLFLVVEAGASVALDKAQTLFLVTVL